MTDHCQQARLTYEGLHSVLTTAYHMGSMIHAETESAPLPLEAIHLMTIEHAFPSAASEATELAEMQEAELLEAFGSGSPDRVRALLAHCIEAAWVLGAYNAHTILLPWPLRVGDRDDWTPGALGTLWGTQLAREFVLRLRKLGWSLKDVDPRRRTSAWDVMPSRSPQMRKPQTDCISAGADDLAHPRRAVRGELPEVESHSRGDG